MRRSKTYLSSAACSARKECTRISGDNIYCNSQVKLHFSNNIGANNMHLGN